MSTAPTAGGMSSIPSSPVMPSVDIMRFFRADAAYAIPALYERLEDAGYFYAIRMKKNAVLEGASPTG